MYTLVHDGAELDRTGEGEGERQSEVNGKKGDRYIVGSRWRVCDLYCEDWSVKSICV